MVDIADTKLGAEGAVKLSFTGGALKVVASYGGYHRWPCRQ